MADQTIDYEALAQEALKSVVRTVLSRVAETGRLPGNHHFYIAFNTQSEGVGLSKRLREQHPEEMMIVLQHRFWDLQVHEDRFEVKLTFNSIPERLVVPFKAMKMFFDPSVHYGVQFEVTDPSGETVRRGPRIAEPVGDDRMRRPAGLDLGTAPRSVLPQVSPMAASTADQSGPEGDEEREDELETEGDDADEPRKGSAEVVSLDSFRKK